MVSYPTGLAKIGVPKTASVSYRGFDSRPLSLKQALASMDAPTSSSWSQVSDIFRDDSWTDEIQGVACSHWIFSANAAQAKPGHNDKAIYVFKGGQSLGDNKWVSMLKPYGVVFRFMLDRCRGEKCLFGRPVTSKRYGRTTHGHRPNKGIPAPRRARTH